MTRSRVISSLCWIAKATFLCLLRISSSLCLGGPNFSTNKSKPSRYFPDKDESASAFFENYRNTILKPTKKEIEYYKSGKPTKGDMKDFGGYVDAADRNGMAEYVYLYNIKDKKWYFADVYGDKKLKKLF